MSIGSATRQEAREKSLFRELRHVAGSSRLGSPISSTMGFIEREKDHRDHRQLAHLSAAGQRVPHTTSNGSRYLPPADEPRDKLADGSCIHLGHQPGTVSFDRPRANGEFASDYLA